MLKILATELWGVYEGLLLAWDMGKRMVILETDSQCVAKMISNEENSINAHSTILQAIETLLKREWSVKIQHVFRKANYAADFLASEAYLGPLGCQRLQQMPPGLKEWIDHDCKGVSYPRLMSS